MENTIANLQAQINDLVRRLETKQAIEHVDAAVKYTQLPDTLKYLPEFSGDKNTLSTWIDTVERTMNLCHEAEGSAVYQMWLGHVRNRVVGKANKVLLTKNCTLNWALMKQILSENFSAHRNLSNIISDVLMLKQNNLSLKSYISVCEELHQELNSNIYQDPINSGHEAAIMRVLVIMITNAFIDGLSYDLPRLVRASKPDTLENAFQAARDLADAHARERQKNQTMSKNFAYRNPISQQNMFVRKDIDEKMDVDPSTRHSYNSRLNSSTKESQRNRHQNYFKPTGQPRFHVEELSNVDQETAEETSDDLNFHIVQHKEQKT